ncbi:MAG: corrinoid protein [Candidatus Omnitrophota bacterium]|jgi:5-methyltetrahydrofolate--homocysteine methyltransferase
MNDAILKDIREALFKGDRDGVARLTKSALDQGMEIKTILNDALIAGMEVIGNKFKKNDIFIPEVLISAKAMHAGVAVLEPHFLKSGIKPIGRVVIGTVKGDLHDIGKNIVSMMLKGSCFDIVDFGIDVPPAKFVEAVKAGDVDILAMSSLLTTSMSSMKETIKSLKDLGLRDKVKIMVGGAPVTQEFADMIGADAFARDAATAVDKAKELVKAVKI